MTTYESAAGGTRTGVTGERRSLRRTYTEAKNGFKTSEFYMALIGIVAVLIATYVDDDDSLNTTEGWRYAAWIFAAYIVSRGLAKLATREPYTADDDVV